MKKETKTSDMPENGAKGTLANALLSQSFSDNDEQYVEDKALSEGPNLSIKTRIILSFSLFFALCVGITLWSIWAFSELDDKISFLEIADIYMVEIQQVRRFEKNYLLYGTNMDEALEHLANAEKILKNKSLIIKKMLGNNHFQTMTKHVADYHALLKQLGKPNISFDKKQIESTLREHGSQIVSFAEIFVNKERVALKKMLVLAKRIPFYFLIILMILMIFIGFALTRHLLFTLKRFMDYTQRIGNGDFSPIKPTRMFRDEFSKLAKAFNRMTRELDIRHKILVESHKLRAIGTLVAGVAHELNNPLNNTMLTAAMLYEDFDSITDEEKLEMIQDMINETERSRMIVRNLLDFAREGKANIKPLQIDKIVESSIKLVANQAKMAKIYLKTDFANDLPHVHGDSQMLKQIFVNLLLNAVDALHEKGNITISIHTDNIEDEYLAVEVIDDGPGIPEHIQSQIFDPFFTTKTKGKGTGLGLSVSRGIITKLGGFIRVKSKVGVGTNFTVLIPITNIPSEISSGKTN